MTDRRKRHAPQPTRFQQATKPPPPPAYTHAHGPKWVWLYVFDRTNLGLDVQPAVTNRRTLNLVHNVLSLPHVSVYLAGFQMEVARAAGT